VLIFTPTIFEFFWIGLMSWLKGINTTSYIINEVQYEHYKI
jgi:hypothetical protein